MGFYADRILPHCIDFSLSRAPIMRLRARVTRPLAGRVLEIGFGSGLNLPYYSERVSEIVAVEPSDIARRLARKRIARCAIPIHWSALAGQHLDLPDASVDAALSTFTLCTIPDVSLALRELHRVLVPEGTLHFLEHGRSPERRVSKWQDRLNPLQKCLAGGCHLNRSYQELLRDAGFCLDALENYHLPGPKFATYIYEGRARACHHATSRT
jgi:ubiquinone/menaquinone biosynthesis C-methylase UbiE